MTVCELKAILAYCDDNAEVFTDGYEGAFDKVTHTKSLMVQEIQTTIGDKWTGYHVKADSYEANTTKPKIRAFYIGAGRFL